MSTKTFFTDTLKILKISGISIVIALCVFLLSAFVISYFYKEQVKQLLIKELNNNLLTEISIGETDLTLIKSFPFASLVMHDVFAKEAITNSCKDTLLFAESVHLSFNIIDIFLKKYDIKGIHLNDATLKLKEYEDGSNNYTFWQNKEQNDSTELVINLEKIQCKNVRINYTDLKNEQSYVLNILKGTISGKIHDDNYTLKAKGHTFIEQIHIDKTTYIHNKKAIIDLTLYVNALSNTYTFKKGYIDIEDMKFEIDGNFVIDDTSSNIDVHIYSKKLSIDEFLSNIPQPFEKYITGYKAKGIIDFHTHIHGRSSLDSYPQTDIYFEVASGTLTNSDMKLKINNLNLSGSFSNGKEASLQTSTLKINSFSADLKEGHIKGRLEIDNFDKPLCYLNIEAQAQIDELLKLFKIDIFKNASGTTQLNISFKTQLDNFEVFTSKHFLKSHCFGKAQLQNCTFELANDKTIKQVNAFLDFSNNDIVINHLEGIINRSDFLFKGYFRNALSYLFLPDETLLIEAGFQSKNTYLEDFLTETVHTNNTTYNLNITDKIDFRLSTQINKLVFEKFAAQNITGQFMLKNKVLTAQHVSFNAFDGNIKLNGSIDAQNNNRIKTLADIYLYHCQIQQIFTQCNNFGQEELVDKNIKGRLTSKINFFAQFNNQLDINLKSLYCKADISIEHGELINYGPIQEMSRFLRMNDLSHIKFETLTNTIEIKDEKIIIPNMQIRSDALNIDAMGTHFFDNTIDYRLQLFLHDVLGKRAREAKKENNEFGHIQDDGLGVFTLFIKITGTVSNPKISYDSKSAFSKTKTDIKNDIKDTFSKIKEEFSTKPDSIPVLENERQRKRRERRKENEIKEGFQIE